MCERKLTCEGFTAPLILLPTYDPRVFVSCLITPPLSPPLFCVPSSQSLLSLQRGSDPDKEMARSAAARYVGLSIPEGLPLGEPQAAGKYKEAMTKRLSGDVNDTKLEGVEYLKAQYYGAERVMEDRRK